MTAHHRTRRNVPGPPGGLGTAPAPGAADPAAAGGTVGRLRAA
ncbi:hypothetical protein [Kitasatospora sp. A2-31]|nr:hypothetical protein [Kitasatospora sp. A2-31]